MKRLAFLVLWLLPFACIAQQSNASSPNIVWITCEDISPFIHVYGAPLVKTPNIDLLASEGIKYNLAFTVAGVCAPSRSSIITGMYPTSIGTQHMRTKSVDPKFMPAGVPNYAAVIPDYVKCFPEYLRAAGYYTTNNEKQDYQFDAPVTVWDENGPSATYQNRPAGKPFFSIFNLFITHESQLSRPDSLQVDPDKVEVPPYYQDTKISRHDIARLLTNIQMMDRQVGEIIQQLKADGVYENSIVFFFSDHGGALPWMKREILDRGIHIPLIIRLPGGAQASTENNELVSAVDFAPTLLSLAGIKVPSYIQGSAFLGSQKVTQPRQYIFAGRDRMDEKYDRVRAVRDKQFEYLYNYMPDQPAYMDLLYRKEKVSMMKEMLDLRDKGKLNPNAMAWFKKQKDVEELYDTKSDPHQLHNLAADTSYSAKLKELRGAFKKWEHDVGDQSAIPEKQMVIDWWGQSTRVPETDYPIVVKVRNGFMISCSTPGASIGYRVIKRGEVVPVESRKIRSWDSGAVTGTAKEGSMMNVAPSWQVYTGQPIQLNKGDKLLINAMRIGYVASTAEYQN